jgi:hypothetical protein
MDLKDRIAKFTGGSTPQAKKKTAELETYIIVFKAYDDDTVPWEIYDDTGLDYEAAMSLVKVSKMSFPHKFFGVVTLKPLRGSIR